MLRPHANIKIGDNAFKIWTEIEVVSSWDKLTETAKISLPGRFKKGGETIIAGKNNIFKRGDEAEISLGYYPRLSRVFTGFVSKVKPGSPLLIEFEDHAYLFKQTTINESFEKISLRELLTALCPIPFVTVDANLGTLRLTRVNFAEVLDELRKTYGLVSFCRAGTLYVGLAYWPEQRVDHDFYFSKTQSGLGTILDHDLEYMKADDVKIKVKAISMLPDNKKIEVELGDKDGATKTLFFYDLTEKELKETVERELPRLRYEGYRGTFTTFVEPSVKHGDAVNLIDYKFPERGGLYQVDEVVSRLTTSGGGRQTIRLGPKILA